MNDVTFKIARKGEGKTRWLLELANKYKDERKVYLFTETEAKYREFCEKYFATYDHICPVERLVSIEQTEDSVVLVDNLFEQHSAISDFRFLQRTCYKLFITLEGEQADA